MSENWRDNFIISMEKTGRQQEKQEKHMIFLGCLFEIQLKIQMSLLEIQDGHWRDIWVRSIL